MLELVDYLLGRWNLIFKDHYTYY